MPAQIEGYVRKNGAIAPSRIVRLYDRTTGALVAETTSDATGWYQFPGITMLPIYYVLALDMQPGGYQADIADWLFAYDPSTPYIATEDGRLITTEASVYLLAEGI